MTSSRNSEAANIPRDPHGQSTTTRARAAVVEKKDAPFVMQDVTVEAPRPDQALVRMVATGICATDAHVRQQLMPTPLPAILGHEGAGIVVRTRTSRHRTSSPATMSFFPTTPAATANPACLSHAAYCDHVWEANFRRLPGSMAPSASTGNGADRRSTPISSANPRSPPMRSRTRATPSRCPDDVPLETPGAARLRLPDRRRLRS
ncbi:alcohol dehydrogenase catalytic domain-containing protein [Rhizobium yanglingense]